MRPWVHRGKRGYLHGVEYAEDVELSFLGKVCRVSE
jgi:hypothetical protein